MKKNMLITICILSLVTVGLGALFMEKNNSSSSENITVGDEYDHWYHSFGEIIDKNDLQKTLTVRPDPDTIDFSTEEVVLDCSKSGLEFDIWEIGNQIKFYYFKPTEEGMHVKTEDIVLK